MLTFNLLVSIVFFLISYSLTLLVSRVLFPQFMQSQFMFVSRDLLPISYGHTLIFCRVLFYVMWGLTCSSVKSFLAYLRSDLVCRQCFFSKSSHLWSLNAAHLGVFSLQSMLPDPCRSRSKYCKCINSLCPSVASFILKNFTRILVEIYFEFLIPLPRRPLLILSRPPSASPPYALHASLSSPHPPPHSPPPPSRCLCISGRYITEYASLRQYSAPRSVIGKV